MMSDTNEKSNVDNKKSKSKKVQGFFNIILTIILTVVIMTGGFLYYLIHTDENHAEAIAQANNNTVNESLGNIIDSAVIGTSDGSTGNANTVDASAANSRKVLNENLVVLYNGLILDPGCLAVLAISTCVLPP